MERINLLFDGRILKNGLTKNSARSGIYFVAKNLIQAISRVPNISLFMYLPRGDQSLTAQISGLLGGLRINVLSDNDNLSEINSFFSACEAKPDFINRYPWISSYLVLYDIIPQLFPAYFDKGAVWHSKLLDSLNNNDYYFSISNYTAKDFLKYFPQINLDNIQTIPLATNQKYVPVKERERLKEVYTKYNIPQDKKYLFSLCSLEPRKNLIRAVKTFLQFIKRNNINDLVYVLGGGAWQGFIERFEKEVLEYKDYKEKIIQAGYVDDEDLEVLYSNAEWFVYTSQYEGFGMPPLEAMSCGCPVITSNNSSLPEVVGTAGIMIDYDSDEQHIKAYEHYYFNKDFKNEMAQKGLERSRAFSWERAVEIIIKKINEVEKRKAQKPLVTIITPTFNLLANGRKEWFIQNLKSVHNQTYKNIEHIVIDGVSTDGTLDLLTEYKEKGWIKFFTEPDKGIYDALNKGILMAKGKYVISLNSDDYYCDEHAVEWLVSKAEETGSDACCASARAEYPQLSKLSEILPSVQIEHMIFGDMACHQAFLFRTDVMKELGLYDLNYKMSADIGFIYKMLHAVKKIVMIDPLIVNHRIDGATYDWQKVDEDISRSLYDNYVKYYNLTPAQLNLFIHNKFLELPVADAIKLGSVLTCFKNPKWITEYYNRLFSYHKVHSRQASILIRGLRSMRKNGPVKTFKIFIRKIKNKIKIKTGDKK